MRILSKFHDYYDSAMAHGVDRSLVYARETKVTALDLFHHPFLAPCEFHHVGIRCEYKISAFLLVIAGKTHPGLRCERLAGPWVTEPEVRHIYVKEQAHALLAEWGLAHLSPEETKLSRRRFFYHSKTLDHVFAPIAPEVAKAIGDWAVRDKVVLAHISPRRDWRGVVEVSLNPCLKDLEFFRVMDAFATFQELSAWIGGVLTNNPEPIPVSDKVRIQQRGFDEWSFRKLPASASAGKAK